MVIPAGTIVTWGFTKFGVVLENGTVLIAVPISGPTKYKGQVIDRPTSAEKVHDWELEVIEPEAQLVFDGCLKGMGKPSPFPISKGPVLRPVRAGSDAIDH